MLGATPSSHSLAAGAPSLPSWDTCHLRWLHSSSTFGQVQGPRSPYWCTSLQPDVSVTFSFGLLEFQRFLPSRKIMCSSGKTGTCGLGQESWPHPRVRLPRAWSSTSRDLWASLCVLCLSKQLYPLSAHQFSHKSLMPLDPNSHTQSFPHEGLRTISLQLPHWQTVRLFSVDFRGSEHTPSWAQCCLLHHPHHPPLSSWREWAIWVAAPFTATWPAIGVNSFFSHSKSP